MSKKYPGHRPQNCRLYITTPIYYANGLPHIGHFLTTTTCDILARHYRQKLGKNNVFFTTGLDEHGTTVEQSANKEGFNGKYQEYVDQKAKIWQESFANAQISFNYFVRTTNNKHEDFAKNFIKKLIKNGDVYKNTYKGKYCTGCEKFLTLSDLDKNGLCPFHRKDQVIETEEENYFFKLSKYQERLIQLIKEDKIKINPSNKKNEILARLQDGVEDVSISRPKDKVSWGIAFPDDSTQTIYVWVEALLNYLSSLEINNKQAFWKDSIHVLGKDISWFHNVIWPAILLSANHKLYKESFVHSFLLISGSKISKSRGNIITPEDLIKKFGVDGARYLILSSYPYKNDSDISWEHLEKKYNADLANGLGNLVARVAKLSEKNSLVLSNKTIKDNGLIEQTGEFVETYRFNKALTLIWQKISDLDKYLNIQEPWKKDKDDANNILQNVILGNKNLSGILEVTKCLEIFMPNTANLIIDHFSNSKIHSIKPLFPRTK